MGVVSIILFCHAYRPKITFCFISQVSVTPCLQIFDNDSLVSLSSKARKTACPFSAILQTLIFIINY